MPASSPQDSRELLKLPRNLSKVPQIAYPTICLCIINFICWVELEYLLWHNLVSYWVALPLLITMVYISFTPMHEAVHNAIFTHSSGYFWLNDWFGTLAGIPLLVTFRSLRFIHLQHHKYTNDSENDPDLWSCHVPKRYYLPFRWVTHLFHYYEYYYKHGSERPKEERYATLIVLFGIYIAPWILFDGDTRSKLFFNFFVPSWGAISFLAYIFVFIPHRRHSTPDMYKGTNVTSLINCQTKDYLNAGKNKNENENERSVAALKILTPLMLCQNYHNIHHLYPWIPFYKYSKIWYKFDEYFIQKGTKIVPLFPLFKKQND